MERAQPIRLSPRVFWTIALTLFAVAYNVSALPVIMPAVVRDLDASMGAIQSVLVLFSLVTAAFAPTAENLCKRFGRTRVFLVSSGVYGAGIVTSALSPSLSAFAIGFVGLAGLGAATLVSTPFTIADLAYGGKIDARVTVALSVATTAGTVAGALIAGFFASGPGWRWSFVPSLAIMAVVLAFSRDLPKIGAKGNQPIDWIGGLLSFAGLGSILLGVTIGAEYGWWEPRHEIAIAGRVLTPFAISVAPTLLATGAISLGLLVYWERRLASRGLVPFVSAGLLRKPVFVIGTLAAMLQTLVITGVQFNLYQFLPLAASLDPFRTALAIVPYSATLTVAIVAIRVLRVSERVATKYVVYAGLALLAAGVAMLHGRLTVGLHPLDLLPGLVAMGAGSGLFMASIGDLTYAAASDDEKPEGSAIYNPVQNLGSSLGRAILGTFFVFASARGIVDGVTQTLGTTLSGHQRRDVIFQLQEMIQTMPREDLVAAVLAKFPPGIGPIVRSVELEAATYGIRTSLFLALGFIVLAFLLARMLPPSARQATGIAESPDARSATR